MKRLLSVTLLFFMGCSLKVYELINEIRALQIELNESKSKEFSHKDFKGYYNSQKIELINDEEKNRYKTIVETGL